MMKSYATTKPAVTFWILVTLVLAIGYAGLAVFSSSEIEGVPSVALQAAFPVRVDVQGMSVDGAASSAVTRLSPRGNESTMQRYALATDGGTWYSANNYFRSIRLYLSQKALREIDGVAVHFGNQSLSTGPPDHEASSWRRVSWEEVDLPKSLGPYVDEESVVYELVPRVQLSARTVLPVIGDATNYVGDLRLAFWSIVFAATLVGPIAILVIYSHARKMGEAAILKYVVLLVGVTVGSVTLLQFLSVSKMPLQYVQPAVLVSSGVSLSLILFLLWRSRTIGVSERPYASSRTQRKGLTIEIAALAALTATGLLLRVADLDSLMRVDMYNLSAALSLHDTGAFLYERNIDLSRSLAFLFDRFGRSLEVAKIPFVVAGSLTIPVIYFIARYVSRLVAILSAAIFAIAPNHIAMAGHVREYSVNLFVGSLAILFLFSVHRRFSKRPQIYIPLIALSLLAILLGVTVYSQAVNNGTIRAVVQLCVFIVLPLLLHHIADSFPRLLFPAALIAFVLFAVGFFMLDRLGPFAEGITLQSSFPRAYLDPNALDTMHTFSLAAVPALFIAGLLLLPLVRSRRSPYLDALGFGFGATLVVYSLKLSAGGADRYLYHTA
ncbi:MAG: hypothetical protein GVY29_11925, partial [Spirochaetes bacterium]|nr:hypothetical protein [Spirochaetota bacterium]